MTTNDKNDTSGTFQPSQAVLDAIHAYQKEHPSEASEDDANIDDYFCSLKDYGELLDKPPAADDKAQAIPDGSILWMDAINPSDRIDWNFDDFDALNRRLIVKSLWIWPHGLVFPIGNGLLQAVDKANNRSTVIDLEGRRVTDLWFANDGLDDKYGSHNNCRNRCVRADSPKHRFACSRIFLKKKGENVWRLFDEKFNLVSDNVYLQTAECFENGLAWARKPDGTAVVVHTDGSETPIAGDYAYLDSFNGAAAAVSTVKVTDNEFKYCYGIHALVQKKGCWGLIDKEGRKILAPQYDYLKPLHDGLFLAAKVVSTTSYVDAWGRREFEEKLQFGIVNDQAQVVIPFGPNLEIIENHASDDGLFADGMHFCFCKDEKWAVVDFHGREIFAGYMTDAWNHLFATAVGAGDERRIDFVDAATGKSVLKDSAIIKGFVRPANDQWIEVVTSETAGDWPQRWAYINGEFDSEEHFFRRGGAFKDKLLHWLEYNFIDNAASHFMGFKAPCDLHQNWHDHWRDKPLALMPTEAGTRLVRLEVEPFDWQSQEARD